MSGHMPNLRGGRQDPPKHANRCSPHYLHELRDPRDPRDPRDWVDADAATSSILAIKLAPPHLPASLILRERVHRRVRDALQRPLVVVSAPAGFGKTTVLAQWLGASARPAAWVSLDEGDNDPVRFWTCVLAALDRLVPGIFRELAPLAVDAHQRPPERLLAAL